MAIGPPQRPSFGEAILPDADESRASRTPLQIVARVAELRSVHTAFTWFRSHARELEDLQLEVTAIPAPPWGETARCDWLRQRFEASGLADVQQDELGNVFGVRAGTDLRPPYIALSAHLDTVFPDSTT